ncbi:MAG: hypothetical protein JSW60_02145 [Thermoplasmatales archaeon]|nr:MAG: hypothetical protein JSW60_02145 [Thermoplasmatales archaeon]
MGKNDNIFVKLQIEKDRNSRKLVLNVHFDADTPNFFTDKNVLIWYPTIEEIGFVNEAFEMISHHKNVRKNKEDNKISTHIENKKEKHTKTSNEEEVASKAKEEKEDTEENSSLSDSEKKEVNEWFV